MSKPFIPKSNLVHGAISAIQSAISSLHMYPRPIEESSGNKNDKYLSETDSNAKHCIEHLNAAIDILSAIDGIDVDVEQFWRYLKEDGGVVSDVHLRLLRRYEKVDVL